MRIAYSSVIEYRPWQISGEDFTLSNMVNIGRYGEFPAIIRYGATKCCYCGILALHHPPSITLAHSSFYYVSMLIYLGYMLDQRLRDPVGSIFVICGFWILILFHQNSLCKTLVISNIVFFFYTYNRPTSYHITYYYYFTGETWRYPQALQCSCGRE
jgi:hypothetical protein